MLIERLQAEWRTRGGDHHADSLIKVTSDGLTLGAGTILFGRSQGGPLTDEARLQALLTTAYGPAAARDAFAHVELAGRRWLEGKTGRASLHLALARLPRLAQPEQAAKRLFMADHFMRAGVTPESILDVLTNGPATEPAALKAYNPDQPRVPAGDGRPSGRWSSDPGDQSEVSTSQAANCATGVLAPPAWNAGAVAALLNAGKIDWLHSSGASALIRSSHWDCSRLGSPDLRPRSAMFSCPPIWGFASRGRSRVSRD